jgi:hypothetical protein
MAEGIMSEKNDKRRLLWVLAVVSIGTVLVILLAIAFVPSHVLNTIYWVLLFPLFLVGQFRRWFRVDGDAAQERQGF